MPRLTNASTAGIWCDNYAGQTVTVEWQLHFFAPLYQQMMVPTLRLVDGSGAAVWQVEQWPTGGEEVSLTKMTEWSGVMMATMPLTASMGLYELVLGFSGSDNGLFLMAHSVPENEPLGEIIPIANTETIPLRK